MSRPEAPEELVESIAKTVRRSRPRRAVLVPSRMFALALTFVMLIALASFGGISYAASALEGATKAVTRVAKPAPPVRAIRTPSRVQYGPGKPPACRRGYMRVKSKCVRKGKIHRARLSSSHFSSGQAGQVRLNCKFSPKTRYLTYVLTRKDGKKQKIVRSVRLTGPFTTYKTSVKGLFLGKSVKPGVYRLKLSSDSNSKWVSFVVS